MGHTPELNSECTCEFCRIHRLTTRVAWLEALHQTYYNQPFAEACKRASNTERERIIALLTSDRLRVQINSPIGWVTVASEGILREELRHI